MKDVQTDILVSPALKATESSLRVTAKRRRSRVCHLTFTTSCQVCLCAAHTLHLFAHERIVGARRARKQRESGRREREDEGGEARGGRPDSLSRREGLARK
jgi:hypothetical protein